VWEVLSARRPARMAQQDAVVEAAESLPDTLEAMLSDELDRIDDDLDDELSIDPEEDPYDDDVAEMLRPEAPETWDLDEKYVETSILKLNVAMMKSGVRATEIDRRLRGVTGRTDAETIRQCANQLKEDCQSYLTEQAELAERFQARVGELGELSALGEEIDMANLEQAAQVETTLNNLQFMDLDSDPEAANRRLLEEISNLRVARHKLRDSQEAAFLMIARYEDRMENIEERLYNDPLIQLPNRIGLEATLWQWWRQRRHQKRQITAALVDLDGFGKLNEEHGPWIGDQILREIGRLLKGSANTGDLVGRYAGQQFFVLVFDAGPRATTKNLEKLRQSIERTTFVHGDRRVRLTIRCGLTEAKSDEEYPELLDRLEKTVTAAKRNGPNRSFLHEIAQPNSKPEPVQSPNFGAEDVEIVI